MIFDRIIILGNSNEWLDKSLTDFKKKENCVLINKILPCNNNFLLKIASIHFSNKLNSKIKIPFKKIWYRYFCNCICKDKNLKLLLIVYDWNKIGCNKGFLNYVRKHFKDISLVYVFTNILKITGANTNKFIGQLKDYYDLVYAFEESDAIENGFKHSQLVYSKNDCQLNKKKKEVFFAGMAKDRLPMLIELYKRFIELGFTCNFHILGVNKKDIVPLEGISYNVRISYRQVIQETANAMCIIEVPQKNSSEWTIKLCEAIYYDNIFITTNKSILSAPFYDNRYMFYIEKPDDINESFFKYSGHVCYKDDAKYYFSVDRFLTMIYSDLINKRGGQNE